MADSQQKNTKKSQYTKYRYKVFNKCPICKSSTIRPKGRKGTGDLKTHPQVYICADCNVLFVNPILDSPSLNQLYDNYNEIYAEHTSVILEKINQNVNEWNEYFHLNQNDNIDLRLLDIGSASGDFLAAFNSCGWITHGIEPCKKLVEISLRKKGVININNTTVEKAEFPNNYFDFIHFWHVLEHVLDPYEVLNKIYKWLKPGGVLNLGTPSPDSIISKYYPYLTGYFDLGKEHTFIFPKKTLHSLLTKIGYKIRTHAVYSNPKKGKGIKILIRNVLHQLHPPLVANLQRVEAIKPFNKID